MLHGIFSEEWVSTFVLHINKLESAPSGSEMRKPWQAVNINKESYEK